MGSNLPHLMPSTPTKSYFYTVQKGNVASQKNQILEIMGLNGIIPIAKNQPFSANWQEDISNREIKIHVYGVRQTANVS